MLSRLLYDPVACKSTLLIRPVGFPQNFTKRCASLYIVLRRGDSETET